MKKSFLILSTFVTLLSANVIQDSLDITDNNNNWNRFQGNTILKKDNYSIMYRYQYDNNTPIGKHDKLKQMIQPRYNFNVFGEKFNTEYRYSWIDKGLVKNNHENRLRLTWDGYEFHNLLKIGARYEWVWGDWKQSGDEEFGWFRLQVKSNYKINNNISIINDFQPRFWTNHTLHSGKIFAYQNHFGLKYRMTDKILIKPMIETFIFPEYMKTDNKSYIRIDVAYKF